MYRSWEMNTRSINSVDLVWHHSIIMYLLFSHLSVRYLRLLDWVGFQDIIYPQLMIL